MVRMHDGRIRLSGRRLLMKLACAGLMAMAACKPEAPRSTGSTDAQKGAAPASSGASVDADDGQWTMPAKNYASTGFSGLAEITATNAKTLHPVATFSTGVLRGHEAAPIVVGSTMYIVTPFPNTVYALDL